MPRGVPSGGTPPPPPITLRGRERYCSGGAWVGPAPEWPKPPSDVSMRDADVSAVVDPRRRAMIATLTRKFDAAMAVVEASAAGGGATGAIQIPNPAARRKELDGVSRRLGGLFAFLNAAEAYKRRGTGRTDAAADATDSGEEDPRARLSEPVADALCRLCERVDAGDARGADAELLRVSTHHWDEASWWFPALKRLVKS